MFKNTATEVFKGVNNINVSFMSNMFQVKPYECGLRRKKNVTKPKLKAIKYGKCSFKYIGSHIWNTIFIT